MNKASRLLQILTVLSARRTAISGAALADLLEISLRTVYRDIDALRAAGAEIEGEAGIGYILSPHATLPPLSFSEDEVFALLTGLEMVASFTDDEFASSAHRARGKLMAVLSERGKISAQNLPYRAPIFGKDEEERARHLRLRQAIAEKEKLLIQYRAKSGARTARVIYPVGLIAWGGVWTLAAWCELRGDYRSFRLDLIEAEERVGESFSELQEITLDGFMSQQH